MAHGRTTLKDIAQKASVSVASVSYVLNGKGRVSPEKRREVQEMLRQAGYRPKHLRYPVFYVSDHRRYDDQSGFFPFIQQYDGMNAVFHEEGVALRVEFLYMPNARDLRTQLQALASYRPGAVVLDSNLDSDMEQVGGFFEDQGIPAVQIGYVSHSSQFDAVVVDGFGGAHEAVRYLIQRGHTRIGTIRWNVSEDAASAQKHAGYVCALQEAGVAVRPEYVVESPFRKTPGRPTGRVAVEQLLALDEPPTAVFVENSFVSPSLIYPSRPGEVELPDAIRALEMVHFEAWSLDGVRQILLGKLDFAQARATLLRINWEELGRVAARRVLARLGGAQATGEVIRLAPRLVDLVGEEAVPIGIPPAVSAATSEREQVGRHGQAINA